MTYVAARVHNLHPGPMKGLAVSATHIATGGSDGVVRVLTSDGEHVAESGAHDDIVNSVSLDPDGRVVSGSRDRTIRLFDPRAGRAYVVGEHDAWVMAVAWSSDGTRLVSGSEDGSFGLWDPEGASVRRIDLGYPVNAVDWRSDVIAVANGNRTLYLFDADGTPRAEIPGAEQMLWSAAISPDATRVAWTGRDRYLRIAAVDGGDQIVVPAHSAQVWSVAWDESGARLATASADGTAAIWSPTGEALERIHIGAWARRAVFRGVEMFLATEDGDLRIFSENGQPSVAPDAATVPPPPRECTHWDPRVVESGPRPRCEECGSILEPRLCVTCGHIGCCESQLAHGTKHWLKTGHPNTVPAVPGPYRWRWCYADDMYVKQVVAPDSL